MMCVKYIYYIKSMKYGILYAFYKMPKTDGQCMKRFRISHIHLAFDRLTKF